MELSDWSAGGNAGAHSITWTLDTPKQGQLRWQTYGHAWQSCCCTSVASCQPEQSGRDEHCCHAFAKMPQSSSNLGLCAEMLRFCEAQVDGSATCATSGRAVPVSLSWYPSRAAASCKRLPSRSVMPLHSVCATVCRARAMIGHPVLLQSGPRSGKHFCHDPRLAQSSENLQPSPDAILRWCHALDTGHRKLNQILKYSGTQIKYPPSIHTLEEGTIL
jgi:hypothetical protein